MDWLNINKEQVLSAVRWMGTVAGTWLVAQGYGDAATWVAVTCGAVALVSLAFSMKAHA